MRLDERVRWLAPEDNGATPEWHRDTENLCIERMPSLTNRLGAHQSLATLRRCLCRLALQRAAIEKHRDGIAWLL